MAKRSWWWVKDATRGQLRFLTLMCLCFGIMIVALALPGMNHWSALAGLCWLLMAFIYWLQMRRGIYVEKPPAVVEDEDAAK
jgi:hypothetical protein